MVLRHRRIKVNFEEFLKSINFDPETEFSGHYEALKMCWNSALDAAKEKVYEIDDHGIEELKVKA